MRPAVLGLVADDLTGAGDSAVGFAAAGWTAVLALRATHLQLPRAAARPAVLAVSTGTRAAPDDEAAERTAQAVEALVTAGAERLYVKVDSTVRGSVAGQVDGALAAWSRVHAGARAVVCPAFPVQGRTVVDGEVRVAGAALALSAAALDPLTPRSDGRLTRVVPGAERHPDGELSGAPGSRLVVDARDERDLDRLARRVDAAGPALVLVGSGGLAAALGRAWAVPVLRPAPAPVAGRLLVAVSSLHPAALDQVGWLRARAATGVDVLTTGSEVVSPVAAARDLADRVADALDARPYDALVVVGGDGAAAVLDRLATVGVEVDGEVVPGCPSGTLRGGAADGLRLVTRSGGFGQTSALDAVVRALRHAAAPRAPLGSHPPRQPDAGSRPTPKEAR